MSKNIVVGLPISSAPFTTRVLPHLLERFAAFGRMICHIYHNVFDIFIRTFLAYLSELIATFIGTFLAHL
jgi:hypothetical protein